MEKPQDRPVTSEFNVTVYLGQSQIEAVQKYIEYCGPSIESFEMALAVLLQRAIIEERCRQNRQERTDAEISSLIENGGSSVEMSGPPVAIALVSDHKKRG